MPDSQLITLFDAEVFTKSFDSASPEVKGQISGVIGDHLSSLRIRIRRTNEELEVIQEQLLHQFPNFETPIKVIFDQLYLSSMSKTKGVYFRPILLVGPPGVGKTMFARALGEVLQTGFHHFDMSTATCSMHFAGSSPRWGNGGMGVVAKILLGAKIANPVLMLDEVDKVATTVSTDTGLSQDPAKMLISLLESHSAKHWKDEFIGFDIDASHMMIVATANHPESMSDFILSRFNIVNVNTPEPEQVKSIAHSIYQNQVSEMELHDVMDTELSNDVVEMLTDNIKDLRILKRIILEAMSNAARDGETKVMQVHMSLAIKKAWQTSIRTKRNPVGFIH